MLEEFVPESELERAYIQATCWDAQRRARRLRLAVERSEWSISTGIALASFVNYADGEPWKVQFSDVTLHLNAFLLKLSGKEKFDLFRSCKHAVQTLIEKGDELETEGCRVILQVMLKVFFQNRDVTGVQIIAMMQMLHDLYGGPQWLSLFASFATSKEWQGVHTEAQTEFFGAPAPQWRAARGRSPEVVWREQVGFFTIGTDSVTQPSTPGPPPPRHKPISPPAKIPKRSVISKLNTPQQNLVILHNHLADAIEEFGWGSTETVHALVRLAEFANDQKLVPVNDYLQDLNKILGDESVAVSEFDLRRIYSVAGRVQNEEPLAPLVEEAQRLIFARRQKLLGPDMSLAIPLTRLLVLWDLTDKLGDGAAFCAAVLDWVRKSFPEDDIVTRQIRSVNDRVQALYKEKARKEQTSSAKLISLEHEEPVEFIAMLSIVALDHLQNGRLQDAEKVLHESLAYYMECSSDTARRVGEMLWLLTETELRECVEFRKKLIEQSMHKAFDQYLRRRFVQHVQRLLSFLPLNQREETLEWVAKVSAATDRSKELDYHVTSWNRLLSLHKIHEKVNSKRLKAELYKRLKQRSLTFVDLLIANEIGDNLSDDYLRRGDPESAIMILKKLLEISTQPPDDVNKILVRLARMHMAQDNICDAMAVLYMAFSNLVSPYDDSDPEADLLVLEQR